MLTGSLSVTGRAPDSSPVRHEVRLIADLDAFRALRQEWENLAAAADSYSFSLTYPYCELAAELALAKGADVAVAVVYEHRELRALWPITISRHGLLRIARPLGCGSDEEYSAPLVHALASSTVITEVLHAATGVRADILEIRFVRSESALQEAIVPFKQSWLLPFVPKRLHYLPGYSISLREFERWDDFSATLSKSLRAELRSHLRRLSAKGHAEFGWCRTADDAEAVLTWLFTTKRRWAISRGLNTKFLTNEQVLEFFVALARRTDLSTTPLITYVKLDGRPVAASVNLVSPRSFEGFILTYDEALRDCSPGSLLQEFCVKWSHANGRDFDFRPLYSAYKARWANRETLHDTHTLFLTARGRLEEFALLADYTTRALSRVRKVIANRISSATAFVSGSRRRAATRGPRTNS
ncbi:MAG: GNAT family N-acetyltransferase [Paraburkholderia sp.]|uniref:GNAT family N-acetyltransferase n=1 Tax=Paraburkholderia sp. TaxID=1926495 RepID=UPI003C692AC5